MWCESCLLPHLHNQFSQDLQALLHLCPRGTHGAQHVSMQANCADVSFNGCSTEIAAAADERSETVNDLEPLHPSVQANS